jgi:hypothetical protein
MKTTRILASILVVVLLVISESTIIVHAQSVQKQTFFTDDYGDTAEINSAGTNVFAYDLSQSLQNEPNGGWISGDTYQVNWTIRLDYIDQDIINGSSYVLFYLPSPLDTNSNVVTQVITNQTQLSLTQKTGTLSATFKPENATGYYFSLNLRFAVYINGVIAPYHLRTDASQNADISTVISQNTEISPNTLSNENPLEVAQAPEIPSLAVVTTLLIAVTVFSVVLLMVRKRIVHQS